MQSNREYGDEFEREFAQLITGKQQPNSGGGFWHKLDVRGISMLVSCKRTKHKSFSVTTDLLHEAESAVWGPGGLGPDAIPAVAVSVDNEPYIIMRASEFVRAVTNENVAILPNRNEERKIRTRKPRMAREAEDG